MNSAQQQEVQGVLNKIASLKLPTLKQIARTISVAQSGRKADIQDRVLRFIQIGIDNQDFPRIFAIKELVLDAINNRPTQSYEILARKYALENPNGWNNGSVPHGMPMSQGSSQNASQKKPWLFFRENPFFALKKLVTSNAGACLKAPDTRGTGRVSFMLNDSDLQLLKTSRTAKLLLLCGVYDKNKPTTDAYVEFPSPIEIHFNDVQVKDNVKGIKNKPGTTKPANLTPYVRSNNTLQIVYAFTKVDYLVFCYIVEEIPPERILANVLANPRTLKQTTLDAFRTGQDNNGDDNDDDDELVEMATRLSLKCPLSFQRMKYPVKSIYCSHLPCFDALSFIYLQEQAATWTCPLCNCPVKVKDLSVNEYVSDILKNTPEECDTVEIELDGSWTPLFENEDGHYQKGQPELTAKSISAEPVVGQLQPHPSGDEGTAPKTEHTPSNSTPIPQAPQGAQLALPRSVVGTPRRSASEPIVISLDSDDEDFDSELVHLQPSRPQDTEPVQPTQTVPAHLAVHPPHQSSDIPANSDSTTSPMSALPTTETMNKHDTVNEPYALPVNAPQPHATTNGTATLTAVSPTVPVAHNPIVPSAPHAGTPPCPHLLQSVSTVPAIHIPLVQPFPPDSQRPVQMASILPPQPVPPTTLSVPHLLSVQKQHDTHNSSMLTEAAPPHIRGLDLLPSPASFHLPITQMINEENKPQTHTPLSTTQSINETNRPQALSVPYTPHPSFLGTTSTAGQANETNQTGQDGETFKDTQNTRVTQRTIGQTGPAINGTRKASFPGTLNVASYDQEISEIASLSKRLHEINQLQQSKITQEHTMSPMANGTLKTSVSSHGSPPVPPPHFVDQPAPSSFIPHVSQSSLLSGRQSTQVNSPSPALSTPADSSAPSTISVQSISLPSAPVIPRLSSPLLSTPSVQPVNQMKLPPVIPMKRVSSNPSVTIAQSELKNNLNSYSERSGISRANTIHTTRPTGSSSALSYIQSLNDNIQRYSSNGATRRPTQLDPPSTGESSTPQQPRSFSPSRFADPQRSTLGSPPSTASTILPPPPPIAPSGKSLLGIKIPCGPMQKTKLSSKAPSIFIPPRRPPHTVLERKRSSNEQHQQQPKKPATERQHDDDDDDVPLLHR